jgi:hypothetical protein
MLKDRDAIPFLTGDPHKLKRADARDLVNSPEGRWVLSPIEGQKGHPVRLLAPGKNENGGGNTPIMGAAKTQAKSEADFRRPHEQGAAGMMPTKTLKNGGSPWYYISADATTFPLSFEDG